MRNLIWTLALVGALLVPLFSSAFPGWRWAILPQPQRLLAAGSNNKGNAAGNAASIRASSAAFPPRRRKVFRSPGNATRGRSGARRGTPCAAIDVVVAGILRHPVGGGNRRGLGLAVHRHCRCLVRCQTAQPATDSDWRPMLQQSPLFAVGAVRLKCGSARKCPCP